MPLKPGANTVGITASGHKNACLEIRYNPAQLGPSVQFLFVAGREKTEGPGLFPAFPEQSSDFASAKKRITLAALLAQTAMAELLHDAGKPRLTFNPKRNAQGEIDVRLWKSPYTTAETEAAAARKEDVGARIREGVWAAFPEAGSKFMLYVQPSDPWPVAVANVADEIADEGILLLGEFLRHLELLEFVTAEDDQAARPVLADHRLDEMLAEGTGAAGHQNRLVVEVQPGLGEGAHHRLGRFGRHGLGQRKGGRAHGGSFFQAECAQTSLTRGS